MERANLEGLFLSRANDFGPDSVKIVKDIFRALKKAREKDLQQKIREENLEEASDTFEVVLERDGKGNPLPSLNNYMTIMAFDPYYSNVKFNLMKGAAEKHSIELGKLTIEPWNDSDEADSLAHCEDKYKIYNESKHAKALLMLFRDREYNPVKDIIDRLEWDGTERISDFLHRWMKCEDTPYAREVSRLIFAGGINRLYQPGCKFDDVPVLIGVKQGEGKSSLVRWLAIHDDYASEVTQFDGQQAVEQLEGAWICEVAELLALTKTKEQEAVKAFITRQTDKYRKPYARNSSVLPRRCIFIGTTNNRKFLKDKTGNRRFYPVVVNNSGYDLFNHEQECRDYIIQCWAEARVKYELGQMPGFADRSLEADYKAAQEDAMEDDWRVGAIEAYLEKFECGARVCARQVFREALTLRDSYPRDPTKKEAQEVGEIMDRTQGWKRIDVTFRCGEYGVQRGWEKTQGAKIPDNLPF